MTATTTTFVERLRIAIAPHSVASFARQAEIPYSTLSGYIHGNVEPSWGNMVRISDAAKVSLDWLAGASISAEKQEAAPVVPAPRQQPETARHLLGLSKRLRLAKNDLEVLLGEAIERTEEMRRLDLPEQEHEADAATDRLHSVIFETTWTLEQLGLAADQLTDGSAE